MTAEDAAIAELLADGAVLASRVHLSRGAADCIGVYAWGCRLVQVKATTAGGRIGNCERAALRALANRVGPNVSVELWICKGSKWTRERFFPDGRSEAV